MIQIDRRAPPDGESEIRSRFGSGDGAPGATAGSTASAVTADRRIMTSAAGSAPIALWTSPAPSSRRPDDHASIKTSGASGNFSLRQAEIAESRSVLRLGHANGLRLTTAARMALLCSANKALRALDIQRNANFLPAASLGDLLDDVAPPSCCVAAFSRSRSDNGTSRTLSAKLGKSGRVCLRTPSRMEGLARGSSDAAGFTGERFTGVRICGALPAVAVQAKASNAKTTATPTLMSD